MKRAMDSLHKSGSSLGVDFLRFEPQSVDFYNQIVKAGGRLIADLDPMYTQVIDLTASEQDLRMDLSSGHRNLINGTKRRGITISTVMVDEGLPQLTAMLADTSKRAGVTFHDEAYFQAMTEAMTGVCKIYVASVDNQPVASALFFDWQGIRYYAHAGAWQDKNREVKASVSLVWTAIMDAKKAGMHTFDLWGVAPEDDTGHKLAALSKFKRAFGGETIQYAGTYDIPLRKPKYHAYELYRKLKGLH